MNTAAGNPSPIQGMGAGRLSVVLGAGGGTGGAIVRELVGQGRRVRAVTRGGDCAASYGTVVTDWRGLDDPDELLTRADMLMYEAKRARQAARREAPPAEMAAGA